MNKRILLFFILSVFFVSGVSALLDKNNYVLGENVEFDLAGIENYQIKIITPSENYLSKGSDNSFVFKPEEIGEYKVLLDYGGKEEVYWFEVTDAEGKSFDSVNSSVEVVTEEVPESSFENVSSNFSVKLSDVWTGPMINKQVKNELKKEVSAGQVKIKVPSVAENISAYKVTDSGRENFPVEVSSDFFEEVLTRVATFGQVGAQNSVTVQAEDGDLVLEYYTPAPTVEEKKIDETKKEVVVKSPAEVHYTDVLAYTNIPEFTSDLESVKVFWKEANKNVDFRAYDTNGNGLLDYVEWIVPHLSEQTFEIILIVKAEHLDSNRDFVGDVYGLVKEKDDTWADLPENHFMRVTFERFLNSGNDITLYARSNSSGKVEVYEKNGNDLIATFEIGGEDWYKIYLTNLTESQDVFDLKLIGDVEIDYVVDPTYFERIGYEGWEAGTGSWAYGSPDSYRDNTRSRCTDTGTAGGSWSWLLRDNTGSSYVQQNFDFRGYDNVTLSFSSYYTSIEGAEYMSLLCDSNVIWTFAANGFEDAWLDGLASGQGLTIYPANCTFDSSVSIRFEAEFGTDDDQVWLDCINLTGNYYYNPTQSVDAEGISIAPLSNNSFVMGWCDERNDYVSFAIYNTTGALVTGPRVVDGSIGTCNSYGDEVSVSAFNSTMFVIGWVDDDTDDATFRTFQTSGKEITSGTVVVDSTAGTDTGKAVSVSALNSTAFVFSWIDDADQDAKFAVYDYRGGVMTSEVIADSDVGGGSNGISVSAFNSTTFVIGWYDNDGAGQGNRIFWQPYNVGGTAISSATVVDSNSGASRSVHVSAFNSTTFVIGWYDANSYDVSFRSYSVSGSEMTSGEVDVDTDALDIFGSYSVSVSAINSTMFVIGWYDDDSKDDSFAVYSAGGTQLVGKTNAVSHSSPKSYAAQTVSSYSAATGLRFCNNNFIMAYGRTDINLEWAAFTSSGWYWNGLCVGSNPPYIVNARINDTSKVDLNTIVKVNASIYSGTSPINRAFLEVRPPSGNAYNTSLLNTSSEFYNSSILLNQFGKWRFAFLANDSVRNLSVPVLAEDRDGNLFIDVSYATKFSSLVALDAISMSPLDLDKYVVAWCDELDNFGTFAVYETDGDLLAGPSNVDLSLGGCSGYGNEISTGVFNTSMFVVGWVDDANDYIRFRTYNGQGVEVTPGSIAVDYVGGGGKATSIAVLNSTDFVIAYIDDNLQDARFSVYDYYGHTITHNVTVDDTVGGNSYGVYVSAFNDSSFVIAWHDDSSASLMYQTYLRNGTPISAPSVVTSAAGEARSFEVTALNSTTFAIAWYETSTDAVKTRLYNINGYDITGEIVVDSDATGTSPPPYSVSITRVNSTVFAVGWADEDTINLKLKWYGIAGNNLTSDITAESEIMVNSYSPQQIASSVHATDIKICEDNLLFGYASNDITGYVVGYYPNGTIWNGVCRQSPIITINSPLGTVKDVTPTINVTLSSTADFFWYTLNNGPYQLMCTSCSGEQTRNLYLAEGNYTLRFYANISTGMRSSNITSFVLDLNRSYYDSYDDNSSIVDLRNVTPLSGNITFNPYLNGWLFKRQINITEASGSAVTDWTINFTFDSATLVSAGKIMSNLSDLRIYRNGTELAYHIEPNTNNTDATIVYFKINLTASQTRSDYYMYYGNPTASAPNYNYNNVYLWWDDFNRANKANISTGDNYTQDGAARWNITNNVLVTQGAATDPNKLKIVPLGATPYNNGTIVVKTRAVSFSSGNDLSRFGPSLRIDGNGGAGRGYCSLLHQDTSRLDILNDQVAWVRNGAYSWSINTWYYHEFMIIGQNVYQKIWPATDPEPSDWTLPVQAMGGSRNTGYYGLTASGVASDVMQYDDLRVLKAMNSPPTYVLGGEIVNTFGQFTSYVMNLTNNMSQITNVSWSASGTDVNNLITVQVSGNAGASWYDAVNGQPLSGFNGGKNLVYRVFFNSTGNILALNDLTINWTDSSSPAPDVFILSPTSGSVFADVTPLLSVNVSGLANVVKYTTNNGSSNVTLCTSCSGVISTFIHLPEGTQNLRVYASNVVGNEKNDSSIFTIDMNRNYFDTFLDNSSIKIYNNVLWEYGDVVVSSMPQSPLSYKRPIYVYEKSGVNVTDWTVNLTFNSAALVSAGKMRANLSDLRIYRNGSEIAYHVEPNTNNTVNTTIYFKVDLTTNQNLSDIYMYYGNPSIRSPVYNYTDVYLWWDDFNRANTPDISTGDNYVRDGSATWNISGNMLVTKGATTDPNKLKIVPLGPDPYNNGTIVVKMRITSFTNGDDYARFGPSLRIDSNGGAGRGYCSLLHQDTSSLDILNDQVAWVRNGAYSWSTNTWYYHKFMIIGQNLYQKVWLATSPEPIDWTLPVQATGGSRNTGYYGLTSSDIASDVAQYDDLRVLKAMSNPPSASLGAEENNEVASFIAYSINTTQQIKTLSNVTWKDYGTDSLNFIGVKISTDNGNTWYNATKGKGLSGFSASNSLIYKVLFYQNFSVNVSLLDVNISWSEPPDVLITYPLTSTRYNYYVTRLNYTYVAGTTLNNCWWTNNSGMSNYSITCGQNITGTNSTQGTNTWTVYLNDTDGTIGSATTVFVVDTTAPNITFINQTDEQNQLVNATHPLEQGQNLTIYVNATDENVDKVWIVVWQSVKGGAQKLRVFFTYIGGFLWKAVVPTDYGWNLLSYNYTIYANDTGNWTNSYDGNFSLVKMSISLNVTPVVVSQNSNMTIYGHVNLTNGTNLINYPINIYRGNTLLLLANLTPIGSYNFNQNKSDTSSSDFNNGVYYQTQSDGQNLTLSSGNASGNYTHIFDAGARVQWDSIVWNEYLPACDYTTATFQDGDANGYGSTGDTRIQDDNPDTNYGSSNLGADANNPITRTLIRFDNIFGTGSNLIPYNSTIADASMGVQVYDFGDVVSVYAVLENWTESQATYNNRLTGTAWTGSGCTGSSRSTTLESTFNPEGLSGYSFNVTNVFKYWANQSMNNYGVVLDPTGNNNVLIRSAEYGTVSQRPYLTVTYLPSGCISLNVYIRTSNDKKTWTSWQQVTNGQKITDTNLASRYLEYRVDLNTQNVSKPPYLNDIFVNYTAVVTDANGDFNYNFTSPVDGGYFIANVNTFYNTIFGNASVSFAVAGTPSVPVLNSPANGSTVSTSPILFNWINSTDFEGNPISYILVVDNDTDFSSPFYYNGSIVESTSPTGTLVNLTSDGLYYWRVRSFDNYSGNSSWSVAWQVTLDKSAPNLTFINQTDEDRFKVNDTHPLEQGQNLTIYVNATDANLDKVWIVIWDTVKGGAEKARIFFTYVGGFLWKAVIPTNYSWTNLVYQYTIYANDTGNLTTSYDGNFSVVYMTSTLRINPNPINRTTNVTLLGSVNFTNGTRVGNYPINLYFNGNLLLLANVTPVGSYNFNQNITDTVSSDFDKGVYYQTQSDGQNLTLSSGNASGNYTHIFDAGARVQWDSVGFQVTGSSCAGVITYQEGDSLAYSSTEDTWLDANNPTTSYADDISLTVDSNNPVARSILKFNNLFGFGANQIPYNSTITSANVTVRISDTGNDAYVYEILQNWTESQATYNNRLTGTAWTGSGCTGSSRSTTLEGVLSATATADRTVDVTNAVRRWTNQTSNNYGFVFDPSGPDNVLFRSSEYTTQNQRPKLSITYNSSECTNVVFYVRTSNDKKTWTSWQQVTNGQKITDTNLASRYLEYRVDVRSTSTSITPRIGYFFANYTAIVTNSTGDFAYNISTPGIFGSYPSMVNTSYRTISSGANATLFMQIGVNPIVGLINPANGTWFSTGNMTFIYNATDPNNDMVISRLIINGWINVTNTTVILNGLYNNFTINLTSGWYNWTVNVSDLTDLQTMASPRTFYVDLLGPNVSLVFPTNGASYTASSLNLSFNATDNLDPTLSCDVRLDGVNIYTNVPAPNGQIVNRSTGTLNGGIHYWNVTCRDEVSRNVTSETWNFTISNVPPTVSLVWPGNNYLDADGNLSFVFNASDDGSFLNCSLYINNSFYSLNQTAINKGQNTTINATGMAEGNYSWTVECFDDGGSSARPTPRNFSVDLNYPSIQLNLPSQNAVLSYSDVSFNFTANDTYDSSLVCNLTVGNNITGFSVTSGALVNRVIYDLTDGIKYWNVTCRDDAGHINVSETWAVNISEPPRVFLNTSNGTSTKDNFIYLNYTPVDNTGLSACSVYLNGQLNQTDNFGILNGQINYFLVEGLAGGSYLWYVNCTDSVGFYGFSATRLFYIDRVGPNVTLYYPNGQNVFSANISFNFTAWDDFDMNVTCNLSIDGAVVVPNITAINGSVVQRNVSGITDGYHNWSVSCFDDGGNQGDSLVYNFTRMTVPNVDLTWPPNNYWFNITNFNLTYVPDDDEGVSAALLIINGLANVTNQTAIVNHGYNNISLINFPDGRYNWTVNVTDITGLVGTAVPRWFYVDTQRPSLVLNSPNGSDVITTNNVTFNFSVSDNLDSLLDCNLSLNGGVEFQGVVANGTDKIIYIPISDGNYSWSVLCFDNATNKNVSQTINFTIEAPPNVTLDSPAAGYWSKLRNITFVYTPIDAIRIDKCELYIDGLLNDTDISISANVQNNFTVQGLAEGVRTWTVNCTDSDANTYQPPAKIFYVDVQNPVVSLLFPVNATNTLRSTRFNFTVSDNLADTLNCSLFVDGTQRGAVIYLANGTIAERTVSSLGLGNHFWNVSCKDNATNAAWSNIWQFNVTLPDLTINSSDIVFNNTSPGENQTVWVNATVRNLVNVTVENIIVSFFDGDPAINGRQIGTNQTILILNGLSQATVSVPWYADLGTSSIFVHVDPPVSRNGSIEESNETNNVANRSNSVGGWHFLVGSVDSLSEFELGDLSNNSIKRWLAANYDSGNLYAADLESSIGWTRLQALGKTISDANAFNDFNETDVLLNMTLFTDSVLRTYTNLTVVNNLSTYIIFKKTIDEVPSANSTNNTNFMTGILWDTGDDKGDGQFNIADAEDLVFLTQLQKDKQGAYGIYDYELRVPANLRSYKKPDVVEVVFYAELR